MTQPLVLQWTLERLAHLQEASSPFLASLYPNLFPEEKLPEILAHCPDFLAPVLLLALPSEQILRLEKPLIKLWEQASLGTRPPLICSLFPLFPKPLTSLMQSWMQEDPSPGVDQILANPPLIQALLACPREVARELLVEVLGGEIPGDFDEGSGLELLRHCDIPGWKDLVVELLTTGSRVELLISWMQELSSELPWLEVLQWSVSGLSAQTLSPLAPLFVSGTPLNEVDRILKQEAWGDCANLFLAHPGPHPHGLLDPLQEALKKSPDEKEADLPMLLLATMLDSHLRPPSELQDLPPEVVMDLLTADLPALPGREALLKGLQGLPESEVRSHLTPRLAIHGPEDLSGQLPWAVSHLLTQGSTPWPAAIQWLVSHLGTDREDLEEIQEDLIRVGPEIVTPILQAWTLLEEHPKAVAADVVFSLGGPAAERFFEERRDELAQGDSFLLGLLAQASPTPSTLKWLRGELDRRDPEILESYQTVAALLGESADFPPDVSLPSISRQRASLPRQLDLELRCQDCGVRARYLIPKVFLNPGQTDQEPLLGGERTCIRCQSEELVPTPAALRAIHTTLFLLVESKDRPPKEKYPLAFLRPPSGSTSLKQALEQATRQCQRRPDSPGAWLHLGTLQQRVLLSTRAENSLRKVLDLVPGQPEAVAALTPPLIQQDRREEAFHFLSDARDTEANWCFLLAPPKEREEIRQALATLHEQIRKNLPQHTFSKWIPISQKTAPQPKLGRNSPCPCGSGKKYKKCCLN
jgi:hypothetical protein